MKSILVILSILVLSACSSSTSQNESTDLETTNINPIETQDTENTENQINETELTMTLVESHNSKDSCYTVVDEKVYDITTYIPLHPGGERDIMKICGRDGSSLFNREHGGQQEPEEMLASFYIGDLIQ